MRILATQLLFCQIFRVVFIFSHAHPFDVGLFIASIYQGFYFDLGVSLVVCSLLLLFYWILITLKIKALHTLFYVLFFLLLLIQATAALGDLFLYKYWDSIFSIRAYPYLKNVSELMKNISSFNILIVFIYVSLLGLFVYFSRKIIGSISIEKSNKRSAILVFILLIPLSFLALRGGFREIPRNQSDGFFCTNRTYNIATINSTWNFFNVLIEHQRFLEINPYKKLSEDIMLKRIAELQASGMHPPIDLFLNDSIQSIVLITMEGVSAEVFRMHNSERSYMPFLESLLDSSYYFTRAYSVGSRTEQGIGAILSGSLATPYNSLTDNVSTLHELPSILTTLNKRNYQTCFLFGGNVEFANMRAYLHQIGFDTILDINHFPKKLHTQSLGVPDEYLMDELAYQYRSLKSPFFLQTLTLSTHEPFDIPGLKSSASERKMYLQSVGYLDAQLNTFFQKVRSDKKFKHTLFIITSDHSHKMPGNGDIATQERYHIPLLLYSANLKPNYKGYKDSLLFAQQNFPATLSHILHWDEKNYLKFSRSHFSTIHRYSMSAFVNGYLYQTDSSHISYDYIWRPYDTRNKYLVHQHSYPQAILQYLGDQIRGVRGINE